MPSSRGPSQPGDQTHTSKSPALAGGFFSKCTTREAQVVLYYNSNYKLNILASTLVKINEWERGDKFHLLKNSTPSQGSKGHIPVTSVPWIQCDEMWSTSATFLPNLHAPV